GYPVRLIGPSRCAGRVEVYNSNGWQTVCDDGWDLNDAQVVCRQLGCGTALAATHSAYFGKGPDKILLDDVGCTGSETYLTDCSHRGYWVQNCTHNQDAGVICSAGLIRLTGPNRCSGRVEIYNNGSWGTVCNNSWNINEARVVCRQLGCGTSLSIHHFGEGFGQINEVTCTGSERHLSECSHSGFGAQHCNHSQDAGVICSGKNPFLVLGVEDTGPSRCAGRVEVYYSNGWQTVCDGGWDLNDAQVVCRQLGYSTGTDKIVFDDVGCTGSETHLIQCSKRGYLSHDCTHNQDAGVICSDIDIP
uniref:Soluble scavenger receptor cysteine-rich domain-containing protein SSC5D n=1 Tax=Fundulus heteroclitus TaxID=8078 RepID=A0A3Q2NQV4_FUNHE